jgi:hypothetical protein
MSFGPLKLPSSAFQNAVREHQSKLFSVRNIRDDEPVADSRVGGNAAAAAASKA